MSGNRSPRADSSPNIELGHSEPVVMLHRLGHPSGPVKGDLTAYTLSSQMNSTETNRLLIAWPRIAGRRLRVRS